MAEFDGLAALVTGGGSGIGLATVNLLTERGCRVAVLDRDPEGARAAVSRHVADLADRDAVRTAVEAAVTALGGLDVVVNNAGIGATGTVEDEDEDEWARVLDVNVVGIARVTAATLPWLRRSAAAAIVNTCSAVAIGGFPQRALYSASKGAVLALSYAMAADHLPDGIRVNCVNPATVSSPWVDRLLDGVEDPVAERRALEARQPIGRLVTPEEVAHAIAYLASPFSGSTTGVALDVDGGIARLRVRAP